MTATTTLIVVSAHIALTAANYFTTFHMSTSTLMCML